MHLNPSSGIVQAQVAKNSRLGRYVRASAGRIHLRILQFNSIWEITLWQFHIAIENGHLWWLFPFKMVLFQFAMWVITRNHRKAYRKWRAIAGGIAKAMVYQWLHHLGLKPSPVVGILWQVGFLTLDGQDGLHSGNLTYSYWKLPLK